MQGSVQLCTDGDPKCRWEFIHRNTLLITVLNDHNYYHQDWEQFVCRGYKDVSEIVSNGPSVSDLHFLGKSVIKMNYQQNALYSLSYSYSFSDTCPSTTDNTSRKRIWLLYCVVMFTTQPLLLHPPKHNTFRNSRHTMEAKLLFGRCVARPQRNIS